MKRLFPLFAGLLAAAAIAQTTFTIPSQTVTVTIPAQTVTIPAAVVVPPPPPPPIVVVTTPPGATSWVYHAGSFMWPGDWSGTSTVMNYADTAGLPGSRDISFKALSPWAYWLPYPPINAAGHPSFDTTPYSTLTLSIKPTVAGQNWSLGAYTYTLVNGVFTGDIPTGTAVSNLAQYCTPAPTVGAWSVCNVPLSAMGASKLTTMYKIILQDQSGQSGDVTYLNDVWFVP
jgi:hypothetical protein